jgi:hypothetical protein
MKRLNTRRETLDRPVGFLDIFYNTRRIGGCFLYFVTFIRYSSLEIW